MVWICFSSLLCHGEYGSVKETLMLYLRNLLMNSELVPTCSRAFSQWISFMIPISLTPLTSDSPATALDLIVDTCKNTSLSSYSWEHLLSCTEVSSSKRVSVWNLNFNLLSFWHSRSVHYFLVNVNMANLTIIYIATSKFALDFYIPIPHLQDRSSKLTSLWRLSE